MATEINSDIRFDEFGDISLFGNDINVISDYRDILYQNILIRLITNAGDTQLNPEFGANLQSLIGMRNGSELESLAKAYVIKALTSDGFLSPQDLVIAALADKHELYLRISVVGMTGISFTEILRVNTVLNTNTGQLHAVN